MYIFSTFQSKKIPERVFFLIETQLYTLKGVNSIYSIYLHPKGYKMNLAEFVKLKRKLVKLTQPELAEKAGVGLRFIRELEQGKPTLRLDKVNQVLQLFGYEVGAVPRNEFNAGH
jgi:y4mF family transcriptional regulator